MHGSRTPDGLSKAVLSSSDDEFNPIASVEKAIDFPVATANGAARALCRTRPLLWEPNNMKKFAVAGAAIALMSLAACGEQPAAETNEVANELVVNELESAANAAENAANALDNLADVANNAVANVAE